MDPNSNEEHKRLRIQIILVALIIIVIIIVGISAILMIGKSLHKPQSDILNNIADNYGFDLDTIDISNLIGAGSSFANSILNNKIYIIIAVLIVVFVIVFLIYSSKKYNRQLTEEDISKYLDSINPQSPNIHQTNKSPITYIAHDERYDSTNIFGLDDFFQQQIP